MGKAGNRKLMKIKLSKITCKRCNHSWVPRKENVNVCPKCHSPYFDKEREIGHGYRNTSIYCTWCHMKSRCNNSKDKDYKYYGGRGVKVCDRWFKFENFLEDMGERPEGLTIERINNGKGYTPDNCKWATRKEQCRNKRNNKMITYLGKTQCQILWANELNITARTLQNRLKKYSTEIAFTV